MAGTMTRLCLSNAFSTTLSRIKPFRCEYSTPSASSPKITAMFTRPALWNRCGRLLRHCKWLSSGEPNTRASLHRPFHGCRPGSRLFENCFASNRSLFPWHQSGRAAIPRRLCWPRFFVLEPRRYRSIDPFSPTFLSELSLVTLPVSICLAGLLSSRSSSSRSHLVSVSV